MEHYYDQQSGAFLAATRNADMTELLDSFLVQLKPGGRVLDWGCGSGRDSLVMKRRGFNVVATDASPKLCQAAASLIGQPVRQEEFADLNTEGEFDGIWACASLLHVPTDDLPAIFDKAARALKPGGLLYCSFKHGTFEGRRCGRFFNDMTEDALRAILADQKNLIIKHIWCTNDVRSERSDERWLNCFASRP